MKVKLESYTAINGDGAVGFKRLDFPLVHIIVRAPPGSLFKIENHFSSCEVCRQHDLTSVDFQEYMRAQGAGPFLLPPRSLQAN